MFDACKGGETKVVQLLLERFNYEESGLNIKDEDGWTPFMEACRNGHRDVVQLLLDHSDPNIDLNARAIHGTTAFIAACGKGQKYVHQHEEVRMVEEQLDNIFVSIKASPHKWS